jgi:nitroimidazol reductase NimA-like FMN-containing flavoprotein (pyridoxamine 5'-phosphate oxidase superfamily)
MSKYHMGKKDKEILDESTILEIVKKGKIITLALCEGNQPYIVSMSYGYDKENMCIYMHCSDHGLKIDFIHKNQNVCATVVEDHGYVLKDCTQNYRSVVIWGKAEMIEDLAEKKHAFSVLFRHLEGENEEMSAKMESEEDAYQSIGVMKLSIEQMDAKGNI